VAGFFKKSELQDGGNSACPCGLHRDCPAPILPAVGAGHKKILLLIESPDAQAKKGGALLSGKSGAYLRRCLSSCGIDQDTDCWTMGAVGCFPPTGREPVLKELAFCRARILEFAREHQPEKIIVFGSAAMRQILGKRIEFSGLERWTGRAIPDRDWRAWIFPAYDPLFVLREDDRLLARKFTEQIERAVNWKRKFPVGDLADECAKIEMLQTPAEIAARFDEWLQREKCNVTIDLETTGLKPYAPNHFIRSIAFSFDGQSAYVMLFDHAHYTDKLAAIISGSKFGKIAHNVQFEWTWLRHFGYEMQPLVWDSMLAEHVLDNRPGVCGLKFQVYCRYGYAGYETEMDQFLRADKTGVNSIARAPLKSLFTYNGLDALFTARLALDQRRELERRDDAGRMLDAYQLLQDGAVALARAARNGIRVDTDWYQRQGRILDRQIQLARETIAATSGLPRDFNPLSSLQLSDALKKIAPDKLGKRTASGAICVDDEALSALSDIPLASAVSELRKLTKMKSTYVDGFLAAQIERYLHPSFMLHTVATYRGSCADPNFQNIPKRDKNAQRITRKGIVPRWPGNRLMEIDYAQIEVRVGACNHKDPAMIRYIEDPTTDMHRDMACEIFKLAPEQVSKPVRQAAKNAFVFPQFYGSTWKACAPNLWDAILAETLIDGTPVKTHLRNVGFRTQEKFAQHLQQVEDHFWNERFPVYAQWRRDVWREYQRTGEVRLLTGFVCRGRMDERQVGNYPIQGASFHCLLWAFKRLMYKMDGLNLRAALIGQIHDSLLIDLPEEETETVAKLARDVMMKQIRHKFSWLIVPLEVEIEVSAVDGNWYEKTELA